MFRTLRTHVISRRYINIPLHYITKNVGYTADDDDDWCLSDVEDDPEEDWLTRTEILVAVLVVFIVLCPYLVLWWFSSVDSWDIMHILRVRDRV